MASNHHHHHHPTPPPPTKSFDLDMTIVSAKHLKNVNWRSGDLKPYAVFWLDPDRKLATKPDDSGSTRPVWNERFSLPVPSPLHNSSLVLTLEIFHSKPSETPKPLVGTLRFPLHDLLLQYSSASTSPTSSPPTPPLRTLDLLRPSGRPHGKIRLKLALRERLPPPPPANSDGGDLTPRFSSGYYYTPAATIPPRDYRTYSSSPYAGHFPPPPPPAAYGHYSDVYAGGYYPGAYYSHSPSPPPPPPRPTSYFDRPSASSYGGPSAPMDYATGSVGGTFYDHKPRGTKMGLGAGLAAGALAGAIGGLALEEGFKYSEDEIAQKVEGDLTARDDYSDYRGDY